MCNIYIYVHYFLCFHIHIYYISYIAIWFFMSFYDNLLVCLCILYIKKNSCSGWTHKKLIEENYELQMKLSGAGRNHETPTAGVGSSLDQKAPWLMAVYSAKLLPKMPVKGLFSESSGHIFSDTHTQTIWFPWHIRISYVYICIFLCIQPIWFRFWLKNKEVFLIILCKRTSP